MKFLNNILAQAGLIVSGTTNLNGTSTAITVPSNDNSTNIATTAFVRSQGYLTGVTSENVTSALGFTPLSSARMITINGVSYDLSSDRSWSISAGLNARTEYEFTTTASQTVFSANYTVGQVDVFYNGSKLSASEFTATNGTSVTLAFSPPAGQLVEVVAWETGGGVSTSRNLTINGVTYDLSADRSWTVAAGISGSGTSGYLSYWDGTNSVTGNSNLFWDNTNIRLGIGLINPQRRLEIYSANADSHLRLSGVAPSVSLGEAITGSIYQAKFGLATGNGQYATGAVGGDFVIIAQTGSTIFSNGSSSLVKITSSGNLEVGFNGVSQNTHKLNVNGVINSANDVQAWGGQASFTANSMIFWNTNGIARFRAGQASTQLAMTIGSTDYLRMFTNGNVTLQSGGTFTDAGYKLDVQGTTRLNGASVFSSNITIGPYDGQAIKLQTATPTGSTYIRFYNSTEGAEGYFGLFNNSGTNYMLFDAGSRELSFYSSNKYTFNGGNIGIRTNTPTSPLHIGAASNGNQKLTHWGEPGFTENYGLILRGSSIDGVFKFHGLNNGSETTSPIFSMNRASANSAFGTELTSTYSRLNVSGSIKTNRSVYNWYNGAWQGNGTYWHMKTNIWGGGNPNGNTQYTMSYFKGYSYSYSGSILEGSVGFHNFNGLIYSYKTTGNIFSNVYVSSDGYVVIVVPSGQGETGITIDWHQHWEYPFIEAQVTNAALHGITSGRY